MCARQFTIRQGDDLVDVEFEFQNLDPKVDYHGLKSLVRQLFDVDTQLIDSNAITDYMLSQPWLSATVKSESEGEAEESDPWAFLSCLDLCEHKVCIGNLLCISTLTRNQDKPEIKGVIEYLKSQASKEESLASIAQLLQGPNTAHVGLILSERLINVPPQLAPSLYKMLQLELAQAVDSNDPYPFTHFIILSKTYKEVDSQLDQEESRPQKKKKGSNTPSSEVFFFHPEDEVSLRFATAHGNFCYAKQEHDSQADSKRAFQEAGIKPQGLMILVEISKFEPLVREIEAFMAD